MSPPGQQMRRLNFSNTYGKTSNLTRRQLYVIHTGETPMDHGYAASLTRWAAKSGDPMVSWHRFVDPSLVVTWIPLNKGAWHATWANGISIGYEQSGRAAFTRSQWLDDPKGRAQIDLLAQQLAADGIQADEIRFLNNATIADIKAGRDKKTVGLCTHAQINPENRTDPGKGYPYDVLLEWTNYYVTGGDSGTGELDMDEAQVRAILRDELKAVFTEYQQEAINTTSERWTFAKAFPWLMGQTATLRNRQGEHRQENRDQATSILEAIKGLSVSAGGGSSPEEVQTMIDDSLADLRVVPAASDETEPSS